MDSLTRNLQRRALTDPSAEAAVIRARMRAGEWGEWFECGACDGDGNLGTDDGRGNKMQIPEWHCPDCHGTGYQSPEAAVELLAHCGHAASREVLDYDSSTEARSLHIAGMLNDEETWFAEWLTGLSHWGQPVLVRAAVAAAREALPDPCYGVHVGHSVRCAACDSRCAIEAAEAWLADQTEERREAWISAWDPCTVHWLPYPYPLHGAVNSDQINPILECAAVCGHAGVPGDATVRAAICEALITWSLG